ncbi:GntP family transporter [Phycicoccus flavus]|uniref:GntP family transporter n=1 Tax=Phycicoccus flavus TaxID=2502783 RepID=UPI000FEB796F|nr:GntP family transporter [Phycicoccus flavus]NHA68599.1 GntP family transporter [Phycicoccus flavus]NHA68702.1 GntP family transporter [Phycicoccus flavus]
MGSTMLFVTAAVAVAVLLLLVVRFKLPAFVSLLLVSMGAALLAGIPVEEVVPTMIAGMGKVLGSVAIVVGLGSVLGRLIEVSGGADHLARRFTERLGPARVTVALTAAAFVLGIPVFFDVAFIILAPIVFAFAKIAGLNPLKVGLPVGVVLLALHVTVPPHPGPVAAAAVTGASVGLLTLLALVVGAAAGAVGFFAARIIKVDGITLGPSPATASTEDADGGTSFADGPDTTGSGGTATKTEARTDTDNASSHNGSAGVPGTGTVVGLILLPIVMIMVGSVLTTVLGEDNALVPYASFIGSPTTALLVGVLVAYLVIGSRAGWDRTQRSIVADSALPLVAIIIFVTGAGGVFANVLVESGIGKALTDSLTGLGLPLIVSGFLLSSALRAAQGSATVAILTTGGLLADAITNGGYSSLQVALITLAIGFGGLGLSHINDSGFWIVTKYLGLSVADGLRTWTVLTTVTGVSGFLLTALIFALA